MPGAGSFSAAGPGGTGSLRPPGSNGGLPRLAGRAPQGIGPLECGDRPRHQREERQHRGQPPALKVALAAVDGLVPAGPAPAILRTHGSYREGTYPAATGSGLEISVDRT